MKACLRGNLQMPRALDARTVRDCRGFIEKSLSCVGEQERLHRLYHFTQLARMPPTGWPNLRRSSNFLIDRVLECSADQRNKPQHCQKGLFHPQLRKSCAPGRAKLVTIVLSK